MTPRHGTSYHYDLGCRCDACREAKRIEGRAARDRARALRSPSYLRELETSRRLKERYRGVCVDCGSPTAWGADGIEPSARCLDCYRAKRTAERRWTREAVVDAVQRFAAAHGRPPYATDWRRADPDNGYPATSTVYSDSSAPFAKWADAIEAAGFERPRVGGYERTFETVERMLATRRARAAT